MSLKILDSCSFDSVQQGRTYGRQFQYLCHTGKWSCTSEAERRFDGSSACELVNFLSNGGLPGVSKILVDTDGLKHIHPFGLDTLQQRLSATAAGIPPLTFVGKLSTQFASK